MKSGISVVFLLLGSSLALGEVINHGNLLEALLPGSTVGRHEQMYDDEEIPDYTRCDLKPCKECILNKGVFYIPVNGKPHECVPKSMGKTTEKYVRILDTKQCILACDSSTEITATESKDMQNINPLVDRVQPPNYSIFNAVENMELKKPLCEYEECLTCIQGRGLFALYKKPSKPRCLHNLLEYVKYAMDTKFSLSVASVTYDVSICPVICASQAPSNSNQIWQ